MQKLLVATFFLLSGSVYSQSKLTPTAILNKELIYTFGNGGRLITIQSDSTLYWKDLDGTKEATEITKTIHLDGHTIMTSWYNQDSTFVTMLSDFRKMKVAGMVCWPDGRFYPIEGTIEIKK